MYEYLKNILKYLHIKNCYHKFARETGIYS